MSRVDLAEAIAILVRGGLVAVPTETVYGLAARGLDPAAVRSIFAAKGRPSGHPVILHVEDPEPYGVFDERGRRLVARFWPGPLTLVVPRRPVVPLDVTGGHPTVALRSPDHPLLIEILRAVGPLAAPSANRFGKVSPTTAEHVIADFPEVAVLDGGPCRHGLESTIVDLSRPAPALLRPGAVPLEAIEAEIGPMRGASPTPAPGTLTSHYAPRARVIPTSDVATTVKGLTGRVGVIRTMPADTYAATLYARLRALDADGVDVIVAEWCDPSGVGEAVNDRLRRAAG